MATIVQFGTNTGDDHVKNLCEHLTLENINKIVLVEPFDFHNKSILENYENFKNRIQIHNIAIVDKLDNDSVIMYYSENNVDYGVTSTDKQHIIKHYWLKETENTLHSFDVKCKNVNIFLSENNLFEIDYLFIDIEGLDLSIIRELDFDKFNIKRIVVEICHVKKPFKLTSILLHNGYHVDNTFTFKDPNGLDMVFKKSI